MATQHPKVGVLSLLLLRISGSAEARPARDVWYRSSDSAAPIINLDPKGTAGMMCLPEPTPAITYGVFASVAAIILIAARRSPGPNLDHFPTIGPTSWLGSWYAGLKYLTNAQNILQEGYDKYKLAPFKVAEPSNWSVILSSRHHLEELTKASDDEFSLTEAMDDQIQLRCTLGHEVINNPYHEGIIRSQLTRSIEVLYPHIRDEVVSSFNDVLNLEGNEWKSIPVLHAIEEIVCRVSNRVFVGHPLCRDPEWIDLNIRYTVDIIKGGIIVGLFPKLLRPLATQYLTNIPKSIMRGVKLLRPIVEERQQYFEEYGSEWDDKPNDFLSWLMDEAEGPEITAERLTIRLLVVNFAAVHTTSNSFTQALFYLAANPQYIQPLREEVERIVTKDGWTKVALGKMYKVDSFLKECQRVEGVTIATLSRKALKNFTFSDGTFVPKGTSIFAATRALHYDESLYRDPKTFDPFRFVDARDESEKGMTYQFASTSTEYLPFGHGRHACPGRFFAATQMKSMLAHIVMTYDMELENNAAFPSSLRIGTFISANPHAKIMFRNRCC